MILLRTIAIGTRSSLNIILNCNLVRLGVYGKTLGRQLYDTLSSEQFSTHAFWCMLCCRTVNSKAYRCK